MKLQSIHIRVTEDRETVFELLASPNRFPEWAAQFCQGSGGSETAGGRISTPFGPMFVSVQADRARGLIDCFLGVQWDEMNLMPVRVMNVSHGTLVSLTLPQPPGVSNEAYDRAYLALVHDLRELVRRFRGGEVISEGTARPRFFPSLVTARFYETWDFYTATLGFRTVRESDSCVLLEHASGAQLSVHRHETDGLPPTLSAATDGRGYWLQLEVGDAESEYERLLGSGAEFVDELQRGEGTTHFSVRDPNGVVIRVAHENARPFPVHQEVLVEA